MLSPWIKQSQQTGLGSEIGITPTTRTFTYPEVIAREIKLLFKEEYAASLATVQAFWKNNALLDEGEGEVPLFDFAERQIVADPTSISAFSQFPALAVAIGAMTPTTPELRSQQGYDWYQQTIQLVYMLRGLNQQELAVMLARHIQATLNLFERFPNANLSGEIFQVQGTPSFQPSANAIPDGGGNALVKALLITLNVKFMGIGL